MAGAFELDGHALLSGRFSDPLGRAPTGEFEIDHNQNLSGSVTLTLAGVSRTCFVVGGGISEGINRVALVGGAGGLRKVVEGQHYWQAAARMVVDGALRAGGEKLSLTSDVSALSRTLTHWMRVKTTVGQVLDQIAEDLDLVWRVLEDGTVWLGTPTWLTADVEHDLLQGNTLDSTLLVSTDDDLVRPGTTFLDRRVIAVDHFLDGQKWRSLVHMETER